jgi:hypothetical protein
MSLSARNWPLGASTIDLKIIRLETGVHHTGGAANLIAPNAAWSHALESAQEEV